MRLYKSIHAGLFTGVGVILSTAAAFAQEPVPADPVAAPEEPAPAAPEPVAEPMPAPAPAPEAAVEETAPAAAPAAPAEAAVEMPKGLSLMAFGDAFASWQTAQPGTAAPVHRAYDSSSGSLQNANGFSLAWAGLDIMYDSKYFGLTTSARFGQGVPQFFATPGLIPSDIGPITQAFVTWKPMEKLSIDGGMFGTIFGAEVAESWRNVNYTRGALYFGFQPFWHTGVKVNYALTDELTVKAMLVNDVNMNSLGRTAPGSPGSAADPSNVQAGLQLAFASGDVSAALGTLQTLSDSSTRLGFDRFTDLVFVYAPGDFKLILNGDMNYNDATDVAFYGVSLAAGYQFAPMFGAALRGEYIDPDAAFSDNDLITATLTLDLKPVPDYNNVVVRWDNRVEYSRGLYFNDAGATADAWYTSTVGLVVHTEGLF